MAKFMHTQNMKAIQVSNGYELRHTFCVCALN